MNVPYIVDWAQTQQSSPNRQRPTFSNSWKEKWREVQTTVLFKYRLLMGDFGSTSLERQNHNHTHKTQILEWFTHNRATSTMFVFAFYIWDLYIIHFTLRERLESLSEWEGENGRVTADPSWRCELFFAGFLQVVELSFIFRLEGMASTDYPLISGICLWG